MGEVRFQSSSSFSCNLAISWGKDMDGIKKIKRKILGVFVCMLVLATIPLASGVTESELDSEPTLDVGRVWLRGLLFRCNRVGNVNHAMALRLHYIEFTLTERTAGMVTMNHVIFKDSAYAGHMYETGLGMFTYVFGFFEGGLEII